MSLPVLSGQLLVGLINGSFYAVLSLGLSIIFGLLGIVNLTQGAFYMVGAFFAWMLLQWLGVGYWGAFILAPLGVAAIGIILELLLIRRIYRLDHSYGLLLTFGLLLIIQGSFVYIFGTEDRPTQSRTNCAAATTSVSCSCRSTACGWSWSRSAYVL